MEIPPYLYSTVSETAVSNYNVLELCQLPRIKFEVVVIIICNA